MQLIKWGILVFVDALMLKRNILLSMQLLPKPVSILDSRQLQSQNCLT